MGKDFKLMAEGSRRQMTQDGRGLKTAEDPSILILGLVSFRFETTLMTVVFGGVGLPDVSVVFGGVGLPDVSGGAYQGHEEIPSCI
jgi:hypothetical protein